MTNDHIFLSHTSIDKPFVRQLADRLRLIGLAPWLDEVEIKPGASLIGEIEQGLSTSRYVFAVMSEQAVRSKWVLEEVRAILSRQITSGNIVVVPIRIDDCAMPMFLAEKKSIDFRNWQDPAQFRAAFDKMVDEFGWVNLKRCRKTGMLFIRVPGGVFLFGEGKRKVHLDEFWIGKYPTTLADMLGYLNESSEGIAGTPPLGLLPEVRAQLASGRLAYPVQYIGISTGVAFGRWAGYRLPTPQEWEKAARGVDGRIYPWGDEWNPAYCCWGRESDDDQIAPVEAYPEGKSPYGCYQMAGNVEEITSEIVNENIETGELTYVSKGGCYWTRYPDSLTTFATAGASDVGSYPMYGYRFVLDADQAGQLE